MTDTAGIRTKEVSVFRRRVARFGVSVVRGPDAGLAVAATKRDLSIGTAEGVDLRLTDPSVSRHHCVFTASPDGLRVRDLGSTNGVGLAGCLIERGLVPPGTTLDLGATTVAVQQLDGAIDEPLATDERFGDVLGTSVAMRRLFATLPMLAASPATVLIDGETGTGKTLLARALHERSPRAAGPFVVVDCGAIPASLIESELFGHEKGAFTGAHAARIGYFEAAHGGTVFLDEIGELPLELQPKLLRALEDRVVRRVGANAPVGVDVRVMAATHRDLREEVNRGAFRPDLWYRLATVRIAIPPLRERPDDIPLLVSHFWQRYGGTGRPPVELVDRATRYPWPGNVRELRSAVERALLFGNFDPQLGAVGAPDGAPRLTAAEPDADGDAGDEDLQFRTAKARVIARWEREFLTALIRRSGGNVSLAARTAKMNRNHLRDLLERHGIAASSS